MCSLYTFFVSLSYNTLMPAVYVPFMSYIYKRMYFTFDFFKELVHTIAFNILKEEITYVRRGSFLLIWY